MKVMKKFPKRMSKEKKTKLLEGINKIWEACPGVTIRLTYKCGKSDIELVRFYTEIVDLKKEVG